MEEDTPEGAGGRANKEGSGGLAVDFRTRSNGGTAAAAAAAEVVVVVVPDSTAEQEKDEKEDVEDDEVGRRLLSFSSSFFSPCGCGAASPLRRSFFSFLFSFSFASVFFGGSASLPVHGQDGTVGTDVGSLDRSVCSRGDGDASLATPPPSPPPFSFSVRQGVGPSNGGVPVAIAVDEERVGWGDGPLLSVSFFKDHDKGKRDGVVWAMGSTAGSTPLSTTGISARGRGRGEAFASVVSLSFLCSIGGGTSWWSPSPNQSATSVSSGRSAAFSTSSSFFLSVGIRLSSAWSSLPIGTAVFPAGKERGETSISAAPPPLSTPTGMAWREDVMDTADVVVEEETTSSGEAVCGEGEETSVITDGGGWVDTNIRVSEREGEEKGEAPEGSGGGGGGDSASRCGRIRGMVAACRSATPLCSSFSVGSTAVSFSFLVRGGAASSSFSGS